MSQHRFACRGGLIGALLVVLASPASADWTPLFNGRDLTGWRVLGGSAKYRVENGVIVGEAVADSPNTFLATKRTYGNFILELETKVQGALNSGVQFRSHSKPGYKNGRVHGYQAEIDPSARAWSGGIYDEARRGWLYNQARNPACRAAFEREKWNRYRIEAIGNRIRTWVNGVPCADLVDDLSSKGFIALQVHAVNRVHGKVGETVRFRNLRIRTKNLRPAASPDRGTIPQFSYLRNRLTRREKREGWKLLWDGKTTRGWRGAKLKRFPKKGWKIAEGMLTVVASGGREARHGGDIVTRQRYSDFELELDFRLTPGANSGIKYFVDPDLLRGEGSAIGLEFQLLDDAKHPDAKEGVAGNRTLGSLYDLITAKNLSEAERPNKRVNAIGEWNRARIVVKGRHVEHWLNNVKVLEYERGSEAFRSLVKRSKYSKWPGFGEWESGPILLQDHGNEVSFRNLKLRDLSQR